MSLKKIYETHFSNRGPKQCGDNTIQSDICFLMGTTLITTASIGYLFFKISPQKAGILAGAGLGFCASYWTEKDGYLYLVGVAAAAIFILITLESIQHGRTIIHSIASLLLEEITDFNCC